MISGRIFIKPVGNLSVRNPFTKKLVKPQGEDTMDNIYWRRLERQGDITIQKEAPKETSTHTKKGEVKK